ncbi:N(4)-(beta-N-acetylglucosaminyl)-L-asparaginase [Gimesia fumaroli]|uniref:N(4)-(Beta-N-acetylglucosaminyl)-L-asparaginase n=1 Tax=Gimesia fumaroli TaxID=2527976 RepID=A0A518IE69_9PLAN|nr:N(4)-(beta-N-acetylglucosaminyl)-L-asparaginase [Gimesia fumaroli]QDV51368.1 N(4)-(Beta-N-acetylglucosaminyl)-L-asparaginase precursor [Gimesia fumaroli]
MTNRRKFIKNVAGLSASLSLFATMSGQAKEKRAPRRPLILCSRGEDWAEKVLLPGWKALDAGRDILDAVEASAQVTELDPEDQSVGYGGLPNEDGVVQLDASFMDGRTHNCGSVGALENIKTPSSVARLVMERTDHIHLVGKGAKEFARAHGFKEENLLTDKSRKMWLRWKENLSDKDDRFPPKDGNYDLDKRPTGTINILALDAAGDLAGCTTTSGLFGKLPGRIGDSPIIGAGLYVDNEVGAAGATGRGEEILRTCGSFFVVEQMRAGKSPREACEALCQRIVKINGGPDKVDFNDKIVAINKQGEAGCASIRGTKDKPPKAAIITAAGVQIIEGSYLIETK